MQIETSEDGLVLTLDAEEAQLLRVALERATFVDTRPEDQEDAYRFADTLVRLLSRRS